MTAKGQSALEFLNTYSFVFIILAIAMAVILVLASTPRAVIPSQCSFYSGFSCTDSGYSTDQTGLNGTIYVLAIDQMPGTVNITSFSAVVSSVGSLPGSCSPQTNGIVTQGQLVYCTAKVPAQPSLGTTYLATFRIKANYCAPASGGSASGCQGASAYTYAGSLSAQATNAAPLFSTTTAQTTTVMSTTTSVSTTSTSSTSTTSTPTTTVSYYAYVADNATGSVTVFNVPTNSLVKSIPMPANWIYSVSLNPSANLMYVTRAPPWYTTQDGNVLIVDLATDAVVGSVNLPSAAKSVPSFVVDAATNTGYEIDSYWAQINVINMSTYSYTTYGRSQMGIGSGASMLYLALSPDGQYLYVLNGTSAPSAPGVFVLSTSTMAEVGTISTSGKFSSPYAMAVSPDGKYAYITNYGSGNVLIADLSTDSVVGAVNGQAFSNPQGVAFSPYGNLAYVTNGGSGNVVAISTSTNTVAGAVSGITFSSNDRDNSLGLAVAPTSTSTTTSTSTSTTTTTTISAAYSYLNMTLTNSNGASPAPFQQMISFDPSSYSANEASDLGNIRFYQGGSELYSWCESGCASSSSNAVFWVKMPNGVPSGTSSMSMRFYPTSTGYDGTYAGEAPQLSSTYAQYDNGNRVFPLYDDFAGNSLNTTTWTAMADWNGIVSNGLVLTATGAHAGIYASLPFTGNVVSDSYAEQQTGQTFGTWFLSSAPGAGLTTSSTNGYTWFNYNNQVRIYSSGSHSTLFSTTASHSTGVNYVFTFAWGSPSIATMENYASTGSGSDSTYTSLPYYVLTTYPGGEWLVHWTRIRAYPPSGVMPSVAFG